jgi:hypothetical protein
VQRGHGRCAVGMAPLSDLVGSMSTRVVRRVDE